jgi:hypothetical protein
MDHPVPTQSPKGSIRLSAAGHNILNGILALAIVTYVAYAVFLVPAYFEDNSYNLGVIRHSASAPSPFVLETSCVHLFFEKYPNVRPEDWHRGLSILLTSWWARLIGPNREIPLRLPHFLAVLSWLIASSYLFHVCAVRKSLAAKYSSRGVMSCHILLWWSLVFNPLGLGVLSRAFLDDVPAASWVLVGLCLYVRNHWSIRSSVMVGAFFGIALWTKDLYYLWAPLGFVLIAARGVLSGLPVFTRKSLAPICWYATTITVFFGLKLFFTWSQFGDPLYNPIRFWLIGYAFGTEPYGTHYPYVLVHGVDFKSRIAVAGGFLRAVLNLGTRTAVGFLHLTQDLVVGLLSSLFGFTLCYPDSGPQRRLRFALGLTGFSYVVFLAFDLKDLVRAGWLVPAAVALIVGLGAMVKPESFKSIVAGWRSVRPESYPTRRLCFALAFGSLAYALFFCLGLGEVGQGRYWLVLVSLLSVFGIGALLEADFLSYFQTSRMKVAATALFALVLCWNAALVVRGLVKSEPAPLSHSLLENVPCSSAGNGATLLDSKEGIYLFSQKPSCLVVAFPAENLKILSDSQLKNLIDIYHVKFAIFENGYALDRLRSFGFVPSRVAAPSQKFRLLSYPN